MKCLAIKSSAAVITAQETGFGLFNESLRCGIKKLGFRFRQDGHDVPVRYPDIEVTGHQLVLRGASANQQIHVTTTLTLLDGGVRCSVVHALTNPSEHHTVSVENMVTGQIDKEDGVLLGSVHGNWDVRFCHSDNLRIEKFPHCQMDLPYVKVMPYDPVTFGRGEDQPFPGLYLTVRDYTNGVVIASASQDLTYQNYRLQRIGVPGRSIMEVFEIQHELPLARAWQLGPGETLTLDGIYLELLEGTHPEDAFEHYLAYLTTTHRFRGPTSKMLDEAIYCSWNYGRFSDQSEESLLPSARFMAKHLPNIKYFLIDAGYTKGCDGQWGGTAHNFADSFYPEPDAAVNPARFPRGMKAFTDELRSLGLKPSIWWSPTTRIDSAIYRDHPDWFLRKEDGALYLIAEHQGFLDLSNAGARAFIDKALSVVLRDWGMEALKMDFWSQQFEDREIRVGRENHTALHNRKILFDIIRKYLPEDGVFMTCVATGMGNPFVGTHADTYRNTIDIGAGVWREQIHTCFWTLPSLGKAGRQTYLHNNDSAGIVPEAPDNENFFRLTWCWITMGIQEMAGYFERQPEKWVAPLRKFTDRCDRGYRCLCPDEKAWRGEPLPEVLYVNYPEVSRTREAGVAQSLAFFNWTDEAKLVSVKRSRLGQTGPVKAMNFWTGEQETFDGEFITRRLDPRSAELFDVAAAPR